MNTTTGYYILLFGWVIYFTIHSVMATQKVKNALQRHVGLNLRNQRLIYTFISVIGLLMLLFINGAIPSERLLPTSRLIKTISLFFAAGGIFVIRAAFKAYGTSEFLGFKEENTAYLNKDGINAYIRHPLYLATILIVFGFFLYDSRLSSLVTVFCTFLYLPIGIFLEEKKLIKEFGNQYLAYKKEVPALLPRLPLRK